MFRPHRKIGIALSAAALVTGVAAVRANATSAREQATPASVTAAGGTAPACVGREVHKNIKVARVANVCGRTMRVKITIDNGPDNSCYSLKNGQALTFRWNLGSYDRTVIC
ncbi:hypothetical protein ACFYY8_35125 [Streptosporangium sp. NPDC001559]|uniref:hypothetical protein n=1 Tax=Streptosporangium sp. NPDC001559 TaxID=3366187 RepID=UPI0036E9D5C9